MSISSSTGSIELEHYSSSENAKFSHMGKKQRKAIRRVEQLDWAIRMLAVIAIILLIATIVLLGLTQAEYVHPLMALYTFSGCIASFLVIKAIDCCQQSIANKNHFDLQEDYYRVKQPRPKTKIKDKK